MPAWWREAHPDVPGAIELDFGLPNPGNLRHRSYPRWYTEAWRTTFNGLAASGQLRSQPEEADWDLLAPPGYPQAPPDSTRGRRGPPPPPGRN